MSELRMLVENYLAYYRAVDELQDKMVGLNSSLRQQREGMDKLTKELKACIGSDTPKRAFVIDDMVVIISKDEIEVLKT